MVTVFWIAVWFTASLFNVFVIKVMFGKLQKETIDADGMALSVAQLASNTVLTLSVVSLRDSTLCGGGNTSGGSGAVPLAGLSSAAALRKMEGGGVGSDDEGAKVHRESSTGGGTSRPQGRRSAAHQRTGSSSIGGNNSSSSHGSSPSNLSSSKGKALLPTSSSLPPLPAPLPGPSAARMRLLLVAAGAMRGLVTLTGILSLSRVNVSFCEAVKVHVPAEAANGR